MHTATMIAMHITSDKIHSLQVGCKSSRQTTSLVQKSTWLQSYEPIFSTVLSL